MGGPAVGHIIQRTGRARSSGPSGGRFALSARAAAAFCASGVKGGTFPSGGSTTSDVRLVGTTFVPRSNQNSLRSEERRVGKECRSRWWATGYRDNKQVRR